jgi:hypothetical protein
MLCFSSKPCGSERVKELLWTFWCEAIPVFSEIFKNRVEA